MRLFRRYGYQGGSISDLTSAIRHRSAKPVRGVWSKAGLYREALDLYAGLPGALDGMEGAVTLEQALKGLLDAATGQ